MSREISDAFAAQAEGKASLLRALAGQREPPPEPEPDTPPRAESFDGGARMSPALPDARSGSEFMAEVFASTRRYGPAPKW